MTSVSFHRYRGTGKTPKERGHYQASPALTTAVNTAIALHRPLLVAGDAGTGKTRLAWAVADELHLPIRTFQVRSDQRGRELLYRFDDMRRFFDANIKSNSAENRVNYIEWGPLGEAFREETESVLLIDEIDKAPRDFPNDLLDALDDLRFNVPETKQTVVAHTPPIVIITTNSEARLPDPFLRRCIFHHIEFPEDEGSLVQLLRLRLGDQEIRLPLYRIVARRFLEIRGIKPLQHKPATAELLTWAHVLTQEGTEPNALTADRATLPHLETVVKTSEDVRRIRGTDR